MLARHWQVWPPSFSSRSTCALPNALPSAASTPQCRLTGRQVGQQAVPEASIPSTHILHNIDAMPCTLPHTPAQAVRQAARSRSLALAPAPAAATAWPQRPALDPPGCQSLLRRVLWRVLPQHLPHSASLEHLACPWPTQRPPPSTTVPFYPMPRARGQLPSTFQVCVACPHFSSHQGQGRHRIRGWRGPCKRR